MHSWISVCLILVRITFYIYIKVCACDFVDIKEVLRFSSCALTLFISLLKQQNQTKNNGCRQPPQLVVSLVLTNMEAASALLNTKTKHRK